MHGQIRRIYLFNMTKNQQSFSPITTPGSQSERFQAIAKPIQARPDNQARPRYGRRPPCAPSNRTDREWAVVRLELWLGGLGPVGSPVGLATALPPMARAHIHNHRYLHAFHCTRCHQGLRVTYTACAHVGSCSCLLNIWCGLASAHVAGVPRACACVLGLLCTRAACCRDIYHEEHHVLQINMCCNSMAKGGPNERQSLAG